MSSPEHSPQPVSTAFQAAWQRLVGPGGVLRFDEFMQLALYDDNVGYYRATRPRVGRAPGTDFYTAMDAGTVFGQLVTAAAISLLGKTDPGSLTFVEIGAEPGRSVLEGVPHPFRTVETRRLGDSLSLPDNCIIFSNELFDAQPFRRFRRQAAHWVELGVSLTVTGLSEIELAPVSASWLPSTADEGYIFDAPRKAGELAEGLVHQPWTGLFLAFDYGKSFEELAHATPEGTARAYSQHRQSNQLLTTPGEQDLTCHVCWDWIAEPLRQAGFQGVQLQSQESFFVHHASAALAAIADEKATLQSVKKQRLLQLLHPGNMGQKFQVLHGARP